MTDVTSTPAILAAREHQRSTSRVGWSWLVPTLYILFLMVPIYWLLNMSFKTTNEILGGLTLWPHHFTLASYHEIFTDATWYNGYRNSIIYVTLNMVISVTAALPAAYAFSRYRFVGDKHLFFWLLTNRMAPPAVFALPFFQLYSATRALRHAYRGGARALPVQHPARRVDPRRLHVGRAEGDRRDRLYRRLLVPEVLREDLHAADRIRHRRHRLLLLHVLLGRAACSPRR